MGYDTFAIIGMTVAAFLISVLFGIAVGKAIKSGEDD